MEYMLDDDVGDSAHGGGRQTLGRPQPALFWDLGLVHALTSHTTV